MLNYGYNTQDSVLTPHMTPCLQRTKNVNIQHEILFIKVFDDGVFYFGIN